MAGYSAVLLIARPFAASDPSHHRYGQHRTSAEVATEDWIKVTLPVQAVEGLLDTTYSVYKHEEGDYTVRTSNWSLPHHLHEHIETIQPTNSFLRPAPMRSTLKPVNPIGTSYNSPKWHSFLNASNITVAQACNATAVTPVCLRTLYGTYDYTPKVPGINRIGLTDYLGESNNRSDIYLFLQVFRPEAASEAYTFTIDIIANGSAQQSPDNATQIDAGTDLEGNLDAETLIAIGYPTPLITFTTGGSPPFDHSASTTTDTNEPYLTWLNYGPRSARPPANNQHLLRRRRANHPLRLRHPRMPAIRPTRRPRHNPALRIRRLRHRPYRRLPLQRRQKHNHVPPSFPASCPYLTTVGATKNFAPEVAAFEPANNFASWGGVSNYFPRPA
ncbi:Proteinase inhibitor, propeptide [Lasallia pustulata]|uniref:Proteinase inhibitor, propeptide n=1 Tax=Lasallia pustulata TaxID=136370 RepID=A0A1W5D470_9LECA|nr:Proteinase inhibitor, propeptide [Lasallia pustulata]